MSGNGNGMRSPGVPRRSVKTNGQGVNVSVLVISVGVGAMVTMGFLLYLSVLMTPALLNRIVHEAMECGDMGTYINAVADGNKLQIVLQKQLEDTATLTSNSRSVSETKSTTTAATTKKFSILIGILTMAKKTERRNLLRLAYGAQSSDIADVTVKFILGKVNDETEKTLVGLEKLVYGDVMELECEENMNNGKSFNFFSTLAAAGGNTHYDYVMKTDDDSYVRIVNLAKHLFPLSRTDLYYGYVLPCENQDPYKWYMAGMGYVISWDLVEWIRDSPIARNRSRGTEDELVGSWFDEGGKAKNRVNDKPLFYDHPDFGGKCAHELIPESILIHQVKTPQRWAHVLSFFEKDRIVASSS